jgi:lipopolysaccharide export system protein LptC
VKINEVIPRQNHIVYILMVVLATIGLVWAFWERQHRASEAVPAKQAATTVATPAKIPTATVR